MKSRSFKISDGLDQQLETYAQEQQTTKSFVVREALANYFACSSHERPSSCLALMSDLVGCLDAPEDLSTNKQYLEGFGS